MLNVLDVFFFLIMHICCFDGDFVLNDVFYLRFTYLTINVNTVSTKTVLTVEVDVSGEMCEVSVL